MFSHIILGTNVALLAQSREQVENFYCAALTAGAAD